MVVSNEAPERDEEEDRPLPFDGFHKDRDNPDDDDGDTREKGDDDGQEYGDPRDRRDEQDEIGDGL